MPGVTAWYGLVKIIAPKAGETVVVSAATGAVGSAFAALAKARGCRVVGIAGGPEKCRYATEELGFDACIDYREHPDTKTMAKALKDACPQGIDGYFENVGGYILDAVLLRANAFARVAVCGMIAGYDGQPLPMTNRAHPRQPHPHQASSSASTWSLARGAAGTGPPGGHCARAEHCRRHCLRTPLSWVCSRQELRSARQIDLNHKKRNKGMIKNFKGKTAVLTGAGSGFGLECARIGAKLGMNLVLVDVQQEALDKAAAEFEGQGVRVLARRVDGRRCPDAGPGRRGASSSARALRVQQRRRGRGRAGLGHAGRLAVGAGRQLWGVIHGVRLFTP